MESNLPLVLSRTNAGDLARAGGPLAVPTTNGVTVALLVTTPFDPLLRGHNYSSDGTSLAVGL